jgi:uroporphyrinogen decarboxylase-like protein
MTGREKIEAALSPDGTPEIPVVICYESFFIRDHWEQLTDIPWWYVFEPDLDRQMRWRKEVIDGIGLDWFELPPYDTCAEADRKHIRIAQHGDAFFRIDTRTGDKQELVRPHWSHPAADLSSDVGCLPKDPSQIDEAIEAAKAHNRIGGIDGVQNRLAERVLEAYGRTLFPVTLLTPPLAGFFFMWGFETAMIMIATRPDLVEYACNRLFELNRNDLKNAARIGTAGIWIEDAFTDMIRPDDFDRLNAKYIRRIVEEIRLLNMQSIYYFCGNPEGKWESILSLGVDALAFEESKKGFAVGIESVVERVAGKCALFGNLDALDILPNASPDRLRSEIEKQIRAGRKNGNRFIMSIGSPVTPGTSAERLKQYVDLARQLGAGRTKGETTGVNIHPS